MELINTDVTRAPAVSRMRARLKSELGETPLSRLPRSSVRNAEKRAREESSSPSVHQRCKRVSHVARS